jgi:three-Cys-motif partner protein
LKKKVFELFDDDPTQYEGSDFSYKPTNYEHFNILMFNGKFEDKMRQILDHVKGNLAPAFAFIDPFGFKDIPYEIIKGIVKNDKSEVFINFMYEDINRFLKMPSLQDAYQRLFGTDEWKNIVDNLDDFTPAQRRYFLHKLYKDQLHKAGLKYVISFEMKNEKNATEYFLYYGTNHIKGLEKMKDAMWKVDRSGAYMFSDYDAKKPQLELDFVEFSKPDLSILADQIYEKFKGQKSLACRVKDFVVTDTIFRRLNHATEALKILEKDGRILNVENRGKKMSYPDNSIIIFK